MQVIISQVVLSLATCSTNDLHVMYLISIFFFFVLLCWESALLSDEKNKESKLWK